nr:DUF4432 family protein [uncultured Gellertiella sp.]
MHQHALAPVIRLGHSPGPVIELDPGSVLDLRSVFAGGTDWAPGLEIVDDGDPRIWHSLQGFLFTAGPDHARHPEPFDAGEGHYPLHGSAASHPAQDIRVADDGMSCSARIPVHLAAGGVGLIERQWHVDERGVVHLADRLTNSGSKPFAPMMLYHMNIGGRLFAAETRLEGEMLARGGMPWRFFDDPGGVFCVPAGEGEGWAEVRLGPVPGAGGLTLRVMFDSASLPFLQVWRNQRPGINVFGIEPVSHRWEKRPVLEAAGELTLLQPGDSRAYGLRFSFSA